MNTPASASTPPAAPVELPLCDNRAASRFEAELDGQLAIIEYTLHDGVLTLTHTEVPPAFQGKGVASRLIGFALAAARQDALKVVPQCPMVGSYMQRHAETQDLLTPSAQTALAARGTKT